MPSLYESEKLKRSSRSFVTLAQAIQGFFPNLGWDLERAHIDSTPVSYISIALYFAFSTSFATFAGIMVLALILKKFSTMLPIAAILAAILAVFIFFMAMIGPKATIRKRGTKIEKNLSYALKDLEIQTSAGIPIFDAIVHVANGGYGECSKEFAGIIKKVESGESMTKALDEVGMSTPSPYLRRIIWQIVNALYAGSDISIALKAISSDLIKDKETKIKAYGQQMNLYSLMYMLMAIVLPSQGITLLIILSTLVDIFSKINKDIIFVGILFFLSFFQFMLIGFIKNKRPVV